MSNSIIESIPRPDFSRVLPCPFCGGPGHVTITQDETDFDAHMIDCGNEECKVYCAAGPTEDFETVLQLWNRRA